LIRGYVRLSPASKLAASSISEVMATGHGPERSRDATLSS
jgi:hypothetical protein